jgi:putative endonuclease
VTHNTTLGQRGEQLACEFLAQAGYQILERNWRCPRGEIDIIARRERTTAFVEVKTRSSVAYGHPFEALNLAKLSRLRRLAGLWCQSQPEFVGDIRIDAVAVIMPARGVPTVEHLTGVLA